MSAKRKHRETKIFRWLAWALLGAVLVYIVCAVALTGGHTFNEPFFNCGQVDEFSITTFRRDIEQEGGHQETSGTVVLDRGEFSYTLSVGKYSADWNYLCVRIDDLTRGSFGCEVTYENVEEDEVVESATETYTLSEGINQLSLPEQAFTRIRIRFFGEAGCSFTVGLMQLRENPPISKAAKMLLIAVLTIFCYIFLSGFIWRVFRKRGWLGRLHPYACIELLQEAYLVALRRAAEFRERVPGLYRYNRLLRTILFLFLFCSYIARRMPNRMFAVKSQYYILIFALVLGVIGILSVGKEPTKKNWNNPLVWGWLLTGVLICVSDFILMGSSSRIGGYAMLLGIGFFIFAWNNMEDRGEILEDFVRAIHVIFWILTAYCILFRPDNSSTRYSGFDSNPNVFAIILTVFWAVALGALEHAIRTHKRKRDLLFYMTEACVTFSFLWKTQAATELVAAALAGVVWLVRLCLYTPRNQIRKKLLTTVVVAFVLFLPVHAVLSLGLQYVPEKLGTTVASEEDLEIERVVLGTEVYAAEAESTLQDNRLIQKLTASSLAGALSGRNYIWKEYLRDLNLFGHGSNPYMYIQGTRHYSHNGVLGTAYYYGIFTAVPYVVMLAAAFVRMWRFGRKRLKYAAVPLYVCIPFLVEISAECVEIPFSSFPWIATYILMGCVFCDVEKRTRSPKRKTETS